MTQKKNIWVEGIEQEIAKAPFKKLLWGFVAFIFGIGFYFLVNYPNAFIVSREFSFNAIILVFIFVIIKIQEFPPISPDYLAYYLYKIGDEFVDFEVETNYLKRNQNYVENCNKQITNLNKVLSGYFIHNIVDFLDNLKDINLRLNHIYSKENIGISLMTKIEGMSSEQFITEKEFISSNLKDLANLIHKDHSILTPTHVALTSKILDELKDVPEKPIQKSLSEYAKEIWNKLPYNVKYAFCGITIFVIFFFVFINF